MPVSSEPISQQSQGLGLVSTDARAVTLQAQNGPGMQRLTIQRQSAYMDLQNSGVLKAATVINFNPIQLKVDDAHAKWPIPAATDRNKKSIKIASGGKQYEAAYFTVREPAFYAQIREVSKPTAEYENADAKYDPHFILPLELMDQYRIQYTTEFFSNIGGVIVFEGDIHAFQKALKEDGGKIKVPRTIRKPDGTRSYFTEEVNAVKELAAMLDMQRRFCEGMIEQADGFNQSDEERKNITSVHRVWWNFAFTMGWTQKTAAWVSGALDSGEACKGCGKNRTRDDAFFCTCGRPYNPFAAFMAGENVPESYLFALKGEELAKAMGELERRETLRARLRSGGSTPPAPATSAL
jgi:hypothetical protein